MPIERKPVRKTTAALLTSAAQRFQADCQAIANMAVDDGEVPNGSQLDLNNGPASWIVTIPDIQPSQSIEPTTEVDHDATSSPREG